MSDSASPQSGEWRFIDTGPCMTGDEVAAILARTGGDSPPLRDEGSVLIAAFRCIDALERRIRDLEERNQSFAGALASAVAFNSAVRQATAYRTETD